MQYRIVEADPNVLLPHGADELVPARSQAIHIEQHRVEVTRMSRAGREVAVSEGGDKSVQSRQEPTNSLLGENRWTPSCTASCSASASSAGPCILRIRLAGTLPGRKPGMRTCGATFFSSTSTRASMSLAGMVIRVGALQPLVQRLDSLHVDSNLHAAIGCGLGSARDWCGRRDSNPHILRYRPKPGASTSSATPAGPPQGGVLYQRRPRGQAACFPPPRRHAPRKRQIMANVL